MEFISPEGLRQDGRRAQELRQLKCEIGKLAKADGSATFEMGNTKVLAAVYGPKRGGSRVSGFQARGTVRCSVAFSSFSVGARRARARDRRTTEVTAAVQAVFDQTLLLELLPRSEVDVFLQVLQADGGEIPACINAAMLALTNAGCAVQDMVAACEVGYLESTPLVDINQTEVNGRGPQATLAFYPNIGQIALLDCSGGSVRKEVLQELCTLAQEGSKAVAQFMRTCLLQHSDRLLKCQGVTLF